MLGFLPIDHWNAEAELSLSPELRISRRPEEISDLIPWSPQFLSGEDLYELGSWLF